MVIRSALKKVTRSSCLRSSHRKVSVNHDFDDFRVLSSEELTWSTECSDLYETEVRFQGVNDAPV